MRIKLAHRWSGPDHSYPPGTVLDLPEDQACYFLDSRQAEPVDSEPVLRADPAQPIPAPKARKPRAKATPVESAPEAEPISEAEPEAPDETPDGEV
jgi:hypothetical protein